MAFNSKKIQTNTGNILKDSYYKQRLINSSAGSMYNTKTGYINTKHDSDSDDNEQYSQQQKQIDMKKVLHKFSKTAHGSGYAFLDFICTHKKLTSLKRIKQYKYLQKVDLSYNSLRSLKYLSGLKYLVQLTASNNHLTTILDIKQIPLHLDYVDLSYNLIVSIPLLSNHKYLRVLKLKGNKIQTISGLNKNLKLQILDLSENIIDEIKDLDGLNLKQLYLNMNQIDTIKNLNKLQNLRVLQLSMNKISKLNGLINSVSLRHLNLSKNQVKHIRQIQYLENLMYLTSVDLCYNPIQTRKYYRMQIIYKLPMLAILDGMKISGKDVADAQSFYGLDVQQKYNIFKKNLPEQQFIDRRVFKSQLLPNQTDSQGDGNNFIDQYDQDGRKTNSNRSKSKGSREFNASKRSGFSKGSKTSKKSSSSK